MNLKLYSFFLLASFSAFDTLARGIPATAFAGLLCIAQDDRYKQSPLFQADKIGIEKELSSWPSTTLNCLRKVKPLPAKLCADVTSLDFKARNIDETTFQELNEKYAKEFKKINSMNLQCLKS